MEQLEQSKTLPPIQLLFLDSWNLFKRRLLNLFIFNLIGWFGFVAIGLFAFLILIISGMGIGSTLILKPGVDITNLITSSLTFLPILVIVVSLFVVALVILGTLIQTGMILIVNSSEQHISFGKVFNDSSKYILPLFLTSLLSFLFLFGSFFVFVIPAIILGFLFSFYPLEVVLSGKIGFSALKSSVGIVAQNFFPILFRLFVIWILSVILILAAARWPVLSVIVSSLMGWFGLCYTFTLYKQAKSSTHGEGSLKWITIISVVGWIIAILAIFGIINFVLNFKNSNFKKAPYEDSISPNLSPKIPNTQLN